MYETNVASPFTWDIFSQQERKIFQQTRKSSQLQAEWGGASKVLKAEVILAEQDALVWPADVPQSAVV